MIIKYWSEFDKTGLHYTLARCYRAIGKPKTLNDKFEIFKNSMYVKDINERQKNMIRVVSMIFKQEVDFIFENRRSIRQDSTTVSLTGLILFEWMKKQNYESYRNFKGAISGRLNGVALSGNFTEIDIKNVIANEIYNFLGYYFLKL